MTTCLGKSCSSGLPRVPLVNCCQFMYLVISLSVLRAEYGIWLYQFLIIAFLFTLIFFGTFLISVVQLLHGNISEWNVQLISQALETQSRDEREKDKAIGHVILYVSAF